MKFRILLSASCLLLQQQFQISCAFVSKHNCYYGLTRQQQQKATRIFQTSTTGTTATGTSDIEKTQQSISKLKKTLTREYNSFFNPMEREFYSKTVSFDDPLTSLDGVDAYQNNVDMLAARTMFGKFLFQDAGIVLHKIDGGDIDEDGKISNIITRWTLRMTLKVLPWTPTARFTGISIYEISKGGSEGVVVDHQTDYWDSINLMPGGQYQQVDKSLAIQDFIKQLQPENGNAAIAGVELPYQLLRRGQDYEVRQYPAYTTVTIPYSRRDEGYDILASITKGVEPLAPSIMKVQNSDDSKKSMSWVINYASPGQTSPPQIPDSILEKMKDPMYNDCQIETHDSQVVAIGSFSDASIGPVVRKADQKLRDALKREGIIVPPESESFVQFAQYDAIFSLGKRRGEVWIELQDGQHPWSN